MALTPTTWLNTYRVDTPYNAYTNGDLTAAFQSCAVSDFSVSTGKFYVEFTLDSGEPVGELFVGLTNSATSELEPILFVVDVVGGRCYNGTIFDGMPLTAPYSEALSPPVTFGMYFDTDLGSVGIVTGAGDLGVALSGGAGPFRLIAAKDPFQYTDHITLTANFGATPFVYAPPSGYNAGFGPVEVSSVAGINIEAPRPSVVAMYSGGMGTVVAPTPTIEIHPGARVALIGPAPELDTRGRCALTAPSPTISARGGGVRISVSAPSPTLEAHAGGNASALAQPKATVFGVGHDSSGENAAALTAPSATISAISGANSRLTAPTGALSITGTFTVFGAAVLTAPTSTVTATGRVSSEGSAAIEAPSASLIGYGGAVCSVTLTGKTTIHATGTTGNVGHINITAPLFELTAIGTAQNHGSADLLAPSARLGATAQAWLIAPGATLTAIGTAVVAVTYEAYALNLKHANKANDELTRYTNYPFDRIVRYKNSYYGMNATGLYLLEGTTDDGDPIPWEVETHTTDFDSPKLKTVQNAYFGGRLGPGATVTLSVGETADNSYSYTTPRGQTAQNYRQVFGKGAKARYFSLGVSGEDAFELDSLELTVTELARRI